MATYAIGDIQGCFDSLEALLAQLHLTSEDRLWLCGDLVNRGPKSAEVLRWAMAQGPRLVTVLGNHDLHLLAAASGSREAKPRDTLRSVLDAADCDALIAWLRQQPLLHREGGYLLVHAGLHPAWGIEQASALARECEAALRSEHGHAILTMARSAPPRWSEDLVGDERLASALSVLVGVRCVHADGSLESNYAGPPGQRPADTEPWYQARADDETLVFGHWAALGLHIEKHLLGLDTGCVWGQALTAIRLEDRQVFTQPAID
jgi:bis(5'-nucleosyl)-tetraphosphatase (symmetrical)